MILKDSVRWILVGVTLREIENQSSGAFLIIAIDRAHGGVIQHPGPEVAIEHGDTLITLGHSEALPEFKRRHVQHSGVKYRGARAG